jgi:hypothetical protein
VNDPAMTLSDGDLQYVGRGISRFRA